MPLHHTTDDVPGLRRLGRGKRFRYVTPTGAAVRDPSTLSRIRALAIPPAWIDVWISTDPHGHLQATGRDARGRKQYRYHANWRVVRDQAKYHRLVEFCRVLPKLRATVARDLACACLCKRKVIATVIALMETAQLRVGNDAYARDNNSYGATTLRDRHAKIRGATLELAYRGKSGVARRVRVNDRRIVRAVQRCRDLPGQRLFQYLDGDAIRPLTSTDVNRYIHEVTRGPFTAKDYRTWAATLGACLMLCRIDYPGSIRHCAACIRHVIEAIAEKLGHTPAVCRSAYIHPRVLDDFTSNRLGRRLGPSVRRRAGLRGDLDVGALRAIEPVVASYLDRTERQRA